MTTFCVHIAAFAIPCGTAYFCSHNKTPRSRAFEELSGSPGFEPGCCHGKLLRERIQQSTGLAGREFLKRMRAVDSKGTLPPLRMGTPGARDLLKSPDYARASAPRFRTRGAPGERPGARGSPQTGSRRPRSRCRARGNEVERRRKARLNIWSVKKLECRTKAPCSLLLGVLLGLLLGLLPAPCSLGCSLLFLGQPHPYP